MKKLMIAAAAAAMTAGAFAGICDEDKVLAGCLAYDLKVVLKTPVPKTIKCSEKDMCSSDKFCVTYATLGKKTLNGFLWACEYDCTDYGTLDGFSFALWEKATKTPYVTVTSGKDQNFGSIAFKRFGKKATDVEVYFDIQDDYACNENNAALDLRLAGVGKWDKKKEYMKSASGYAVGVRSFCDAETDNYKYECGMDGALFVDLCDEFTTWCTDGTQYTDTIAYGTWTLKVNTKAMKSGKGYANYIPNYCICK